MSSPEGELKPDKGGPRKTGSLARRFRQFFERDIWEYGVGKEPTLKGQWVAFLRILSISWKGLIENRLFSRAAALSYASLLALGPLIAVVVVLSSSFIQADAESQIKRALLFIAPSLQEMAAPGEAPAVSSSNDPHLATALDELITQIIQGAEKLMSGINTGGSRAFGLFGSLILIWVVIQLLTSIETTLNQIWGVHQGRPWVKRIVFYWTFISLGTLLGLGSTALLSASNLASMFQWVPFGSEMTGLVLELSPILSFLMLILLLVLFYRFFPNTSVALKPALVGSLLTAILLFINNYLSILYVHRVISIQSLYGSMGIIPVFMIGMYFFWVLILLGGQLTYAVQNVSFLANQTAWRKISIRVRELVTLGTFLHIARSFEECKPPPGLNETSNHLHVPVNVLNESLEILESIGWITRMEVESKGEDASYTGYRPAMPLEKFTLSSFRKEMEGYGHSDMAPHLVRNDPVMKAYLKACTWHEKDPVCQMSLKELLGN